jgi:hypothetical protein
MFRACAEWIVVRLAHDGAGTNTTAEPTVNATSMTPMRVTTESLTSIRFIIIVSEGKGFSNLRSAESAIDDLVKEA